jgi:hypothetical protein
VHEDRETLTWFYRELADALYGAGKPSADAFVDFLDSPRRVVLEVVPTQRIGYDGAKMGRATKEWMAARSRTEG